MHFVLAISSGASVDEATRVYMESGVIGSMARYRFWELTGQVQPDPLPSLIRTSADIPSPTLYHRVLGGWLRLTGSPPVDDRWPGAAGIGALLRTGRALSVLMYGGAVVLLYAAAALVSRSPALAALVALLFLGHPQMTFIGACLNSDNLVVLLASLALYLICHAVVRQGWTARIALLAVCLVAPIAKRAGLAITATVLPVALLPALRDRRRALLAITGAAAVVAVAAGGLWLLGMGRSMVRDVEEVLGIGGWVREQPPGWWQAFGTHFWETFWGNYGWVQCPIPAWCLRAIGVCVATALVMVPTGRRRCAGSTGFGIVLAVCAVQVVFAVAQVAIAQGMRMELGQGRHAFVGLPGLCLLVAVGVRGLVRDSIAPWVLPLIGFGAVLLSEASLWFIAVPCFLR
jgi:hypothetical protein